MRHVDEGTLHALLDGALRAEEPERARAVEAHLDGCADCRARLEEAGALTRRADAVLGALDALEPADIRPDFHDVLARRDRATAFPDSPDSPDSPATPESRARMRRRARATRGVAWAASLVLALGTGYLIGDRFGPLAQAGAGSSAEPSGAAAPAARRATDAVPPSSVAGDAPVDEALRERRGTAEAVAEEAVAEEAVAEEAVAEAAPETRASTEDAPARLGAGEWLGLESIVVTGVPAGEPVAAAPDQGQNRAETEALLLQSVGVAGEADAGEADAGWRAVDVAEARRLLGGPVLRLPDAELGRLDARVDAAGARSVRSVQTLPGGVEVRVTQSRVTVLDTGAESTARAFAPAAAKAAAGSPEEAAPADMDDAFRTVMVARDAYLLVVTGPLPVEALRGLAEAAAPDPAGPDA